MKVRLSPRARLDLVEIDAWLAQESVKAAITVTRRLRQVCLSLVEHPNAYPVVTRFPDLMLRKRRAGSYLIFYRVGDGVIEIARILHGARDVDAILGGEAD